MNEPGTGHVLREVPVPLLVSCAAFLAAVGGPLLGVPYLADRLPPAGWQLVAGAQVVLAALVLPLGRQPLSWASGLAVVLVGAPLEALAMVGTAGEVVADDLVAVRLVLLAQVLVIRVSRAGGGGVRPGTCVVGSALLLLGAPVAATILADGGLVGAVRLASLSPLAPVLSPGSWPWLAVVAQMGLAGVLFAGGRRR